MPIAPDPRITTPTVAITPIKNGPKILENNDKKKILVKKKKVITKEMTGQDNASCSSECSSGDGGAVKLAVIPKCRVRPSRSLDVSTGVVPFQGQVKRCEWITQNSDPLYTSFHDEEWGVPVHDDIKLFELLVLSIALAEFTWPTILNKRHLFRQVFDNFDPCRIAKFTDKDMYVFVSNGHTLLSEPKLRAVIENAKQMLKIQQNLGSFSDYLWSFVNHKPIRNYFRYGRQLPVKTPKAEIISKDLMSRGFRCVGPSVVYSFMQVTGLVNDHLVTCFRYQECNDNVVNNLKPEKDDNECTLS